MKISLTSATLFCVATFGTQFVLAQGPPPVNPAPTARANVDEVVLDLVVRDKKGKPVTELDPGDITIVDNGVKQVATSFRLVRGSEAVNAKGSTTPLDSLRQLRIVTLAFDTLGAAEQRKLARSAALDLVKNNQSTNVLYAVVVINSRLLVLQQFTNDKNALSSAIERATNGLGPGTLTSESDAIRSELQRNQDVNLLTSASQTADASPANGHPAVDGIVQAKLASVMLDMLRMDSAVAAQGTRMSLSALESLVMGLKPIPGRKSILYFSSGLYVTPELDVPFRNILSTANRSNVTFYAVDTRGVMVSSQNAASSAQLNSAAAASKATSLKLSGPVTKEEVMAGDNAEVAARANVQLAIRDLAESTGGFLIGDSNDLRVPLRRVNEEIASYYEITFDPAIQNYDGTFRKLSVSTTRKDLVIHARNGYFALPPDARASGVQSFELPLLTALASAEIPTAVEFRARALLWKPADEGTALSEVIEVPLHGLQSQIDPIKNTSNIHFSLAALIKDDKGEVVKKLTRDRSLQVTLEQLKAGNFIEKLPATLTAGNYTVECVVMDRESGKIGVRRSGFIVASKPKGVAISSITSVRSYAPNIKGIDPAEPFQFQGGIITPTLNTSVSRAPDSALRLFFIVYQDKATAAKPTVEIELLQNGKSLQKVPLQLPDAETDGRIPYVMTIPASAIPPGTYQIRANAKQGDTGSQTSTTVTIEAK